MPQIERYGAETGTGPSRARRVVPGASCAAQQALDFTPPVARADDAQAARLQRKAQALLGALQAGPITNVEAMHIGGLRFGARLHELRRAGHQIQTEEHKATGVTVYRLTGVID